MEQPLSLPTAHGPWGVEVAGCTRQVPAGALLGGRRSLKGDCAHPGCANEIYNTNEQKFGIDGLFRASEYPEVSRNKQNPNQESAAMSNYAASRYCPPVGVAPHCKVKATVQAVAQQHRQKADRTLIGFKRQCPPSWRSPSLCIKESSVPADSFQPAAWPAGGQQRHLHPRLYAERLCR